MLNLPDILRERVREIAAEMFGMTVEHVNAEVPPRTEMGDLAFPIAFELAKRIKAATGEKRAPRQIAEQIKAALEGAPGVARIEVAGAGYLNFYFQRAAFLGHLYLERAASRPVPLDVEDRPKRMVEHTSINPNKAAHIGHLRNAVLGDTLVRVLRATGERVEVQNYIDNTGVQVADVVVGFLHLLQMTLEDVRALDRSLPPERPFDYYCWDLYTRVGQFYKGETASDSGIDPGKVRADTLHAIEEGGNTVADLAEYVATRNVECILLTMERVGIRYDLLPRESEILHLHFWEQAFRRMKETGVIRFESEGRNTGCWVMPFESHTGTDEHDADKILVRSNGTVTYTGKDIAYQLWKLGKLGLDFNYRPFKRYPDGHVTWITSVEPEVPPPSSAARVEQPPRFGGGATVYNVIDSRQSYTQEIVRRGVAAVAPEVGPEASVHVAYEMVALSPAACDELGIPLTGEQRARPHIEMSGRRGIGVKADDLINRLEANALLEVQQRHAELPFDDQKSTAASIAIGALRYFLLKYTRNSVIAFDFQDALAFEGETGPYCQYSAVRANSIFRKLGTGDQAAAEQFIKRAIDAGTEEERAAREILDGEGDDLWSVVVLAARLEEALKLSAEQAEPAHLAKYTFNLARAFNLFYHRHRIISEPNPARRAILTAIAEVVRRQLTFALNCLGISVPERM